MFGSGVAVAAAFLLALVAQSLCDTASVEVRLPDDASFRKYRFAFLTVSGLSTIDSVSSGLVPDKFDVDRSSNPHRIVFRGDLPDGRHSVQVTAGGAGHQLMLNVSRLPLSVIDSAVFVSGAARNLANLIARLRSGFAAHLISLHHVESAASEAAVAIPKAGTPDYLPLWEAYELVNNESATIGGVQVMPDRCPADSPQLCRSRLAFSSSHPSVHPATVQLNSDANFLGLGLSWTAQTAEQMHAEPCRKATCLNGGECVANFTGIGYRCKCPPAPNIPWGPRCEYPIRSYTHAAGGLAFTRLWIGGLPHSSRSLEISFEISGTVQEQNQEALVVKSSINPSSAVLSASFLYRQSVLKVSGSLLGGSDISIDTAQQNSGSWFAVYISVTPSLSRMVICPKKLPTSTIVQPLDCFTRSVAAGAEIRDFPTFWLEIGEAFTGCIQAVGVNGYLVDLAAGRDIVQGAASVAAFCGQQNGTCRGSDASPSGQYVCGAESLCYGVLKNDNSAPMDCNCECLGAKRKLLETIKTSGLCRTANQASNACSKDPLIISTKSSNASSWKLNTNSLIPLEEKNSASVELELRTRVNALSSVLTAAIKNAAGADVMVQSLNISGGLLQLCIDPPSCFAFPPIRVDDGEWHSVFAATRVALLNLQVDGVSRLHSLARNASDFAKLELTARIPNSWLRNIRVSGTYMSTTANETDRSGDGSEYVIPELAKDASVGSDGVDPAPPCDCPSGEWCRALWGKTTCECPAGQERDAGSKCVAVNACSKFNVSCPSGGSCEATVAEPGFECVCPPGVTSRMCRVLEESTPGPATAAMQWWIWLIVGIAAFIIILFLIVFALLRLSRRGATAEAPKSDIEQINQDLGDDSGNEGAPPEDYKGPLSLKFPFAQKVSNDGGLPDFQPVQAAPPQVAGSPAETQRPLGAPVAQDSIAREPADAAAGDETLNYGYEDTRDDDAADLDQVSLVSGDTDFSMDLRPTLDAWGPKFQPLSDILT